MKFLKHLLFWFQTSMFNRNATCTHCAAKMPRFRMIYRPPYGWFCSEKDWDAFRWRPDRDAATPLAAEEKNSRATHDCAYKGCQ